MAQTDGTLRFDTKIDSSGFEEGLNRLGGIADRGFSALTHAITAATAALSAGAAAVVNYGSSFETSMAKASTLFGDVAVDTEHLNSEILKLSSSTGLAASMFGESLYSALSAGLPVAEDMTDTLSVLESSAKLATAGFTDVETALSATAKTLNAYGMGAEEAERIQGILIQTQNKGITTVGELGASLSQVTPTAAAFGVSFEQVGAALAVMTAQGTSTAQATTQLNSIIAELGKNGTVASKNLAKAAEGTEYAGMTFVEMMNAGADLSDILAMISDEADESGVSLVDMFSSIEAGKAALSIFTQDGAVFAADMEAMANTAGLVDEAYETMMDTFEGQKSVFIESAKNLAISVYNEMSGPLTGIMGFGNDILAQLSEAFTSGGADGLISAAGSVMGDIVVEVISYAPEVIAAGLDLLGSLAVSLLDNAPLLLETGVELSQALISGLFGEELGEAAGELGQTLLVTFGLMGDIVEDTADTVTPLLGETAKAILSVVNLGLKPVNAILGVVAQNTKGLTVVLIAGAAGWAAYMIVQKAQKATSAMSAAMVLLKGATDKETISTMLSTGALTAKNVVVGVVTKKITLATAAQALWNATIMANPVGLLVAAIVALIAVVAGLVICLSDSGEETENNSRRVEKLTGEVDKLCDAQWDLYDAYDSLTPQIEDVNSALSDSGRTLDQIETQMSNCEDAITGILSDAITERRALRDEDLAALDRYLEEYAAAVEERFNLYTNVQQAENARLQYMPIEDAEDAAQAWKNLTEARDQALNANAELWTSGYTMLQNQYDAGYFSDDAEFQAAVKALSDELTARAEAIDSTFNEGAALVQQYSVEQLTTAAEGFGNPFATVIDSFDGEALVNLKTTADVLDDIATSMENVDTNALSDGLYTMLQAVESGADLSGEAQSALVSFLQPFTGLDGELGETGKNVLLGMIGGLESEIPALADTSEMTCDQIVNAITEYFGIHSPSTLMYEYGGYIVEGLINGITARSGELNSILNSLTMGISNGSVGLSIAGVGAAGVNLSAPLSEAGKQLINDAQTTAAAHLNLSADACERLIALADSAAATMVGHMTRVVSAAQNAVNSITYNTSNNTSQSFNFNTPTAKPSAVARAAREALEVK